MLGARLRSSVRITRANSSQIDSAQRPMGASVFFYVGSSNLPARVGRIMRREIFTEEHDLFREQVRRFVEREVEPRVPEWNERGMTDREIWRRLGEEGLLGANQPVEYGGAGGDV